MQLRRSTLFRGRGSWEERGSFTKQALGVGIFLLGQSGYLNDKQRKGNTPSAGSW